MLVEAADRGDFPFKELIKTYPVKEVVAAVEAMKDGSVVKGVVTWD